MESKWVLLCSMGNIITYSFIFSDSSISSKSQSSIVFPFTSRSGFGKFSVNGYNLVAYPAAKTKHFIIFSYSNKAPHPSAVLQKCTENVSLYCGNAFKYFSVISFSISSLYSGSTNAIQQPLNPAPLNLPP